MICFLYEGKKYIRYDNYWVNEHYEIAPLIVQTELDKQYANSLSLDSFSVDELIALADEFKKNESYHLAIKHYKEAIMRADIEQCRFIYPRLTSCYRKIGRAQDAVQLMTYIKNKFGLHMITPVLLTSVAAAYCDLHEYENARKCANRAYAILGGKSDPALINVFRRINKENS